QRQEIRLQAWQARLATKTTNIEREQARLLEKVRARESMADQQLALLDELRERWLATRRAERDRVAAEFEQARETRGRFTRLWEECQLKAASVQEAQRALEQRSQAVEQYRLELI